MTIRKISNVCELANYQVQWNLKILIQSISFSLAWTGSKINWNKVYKVLIVLARKFYILAVLPWIQANQFNSISLIDIHQKATWSNSFEDEIAFIGILLNGI